MKSLALLLLLPGLALPWTPASPSFHPMPQNGHTMVYDPAASRSVAVVNGATGSETWLWNGTAWSLAALTGTVPPPREAGGLVHDTARGRTLLYGGRTFGTFMKLGDLWELGGGAWRQVTGLQTTPGDMFQHAMAFDSRRNVTVLFGGTRDEANPLGDTWTFDGTAWTRKTPARTPPARFGHGMAFDSTRGVVVLFGGLTSSFGQPLSDTWEWNGTDWTQRNPAPSPPGRSHHAMAFDSGRGRVVLFGGGSPTFGRADTWEWDGSAWTERTPATGSPFPRGSTAMAYDSSRSRVVLFGGNNDNDVWEWDGTAWSEKTPTNGPRPRSDAAMAFDSSRQRAVMFGGKRPAELSFFAFDDTWEWNGAAWSRRNPPSSPRARYGHSMVFDEARGHVFLFGGFDNRASFFGDSWTWNGAEWGQQQTGQSPAPRYQAGMAYDPLRSIVVLFGGASSEIFGDTWEWNGTAWSLRAPAVSPSARYGCAMAFDPNRGRVVLFGGGTHIADNAETWEWDGSTWTGRSPVSAPEARKNHSLALDSASGRLVLFGGVVNSRRTSDTWQWNGQDWTRLAPATTPIARSVAAMTHDSARARTLLFGGEPSSSFAALGDTWSLASSGPPTGPANSSPSAEAGADQSVDSGTFVTLSGSAADTDGDPLVYLWSRTGGTAPALTLQTQGAAASFTATGAGTHVFTLTVTDGRGGVGRDSVTVTVVATQPCNGSQTRAIPLARGINMIAIPLMPCGRAYRASDLLKATGAPFLARTVTGGFEAYLPGISPDWTIEPSRGYLVRMRAQGQLVLVGEPWP